MGLCLQMPQETFDSLQRCPLLSCQRGSDARSRHRQTLLILLPPTRLSTPTNHLSEPPWVATVKLAGSLVAGLEHYDLQATHST